MTIFFGPARPVVPFFGPARPGPARNTIFIFRPVWARLGPCQNLLSLMFYTKTTKTTVINNANWILITRWQRA